MMEHVQEGAATRCEPALVRPCPDEAEFARQVIDQDLSAHAVGKGPHMPVGLAIAVYGAFRRFPSLSTT